MELTACEFEIAEQLALGASKKEVADKTNRSIYTVETTNKNIYTKLKINKVSDLVLWYCGVMFDIANEIKNKQKEVLSISIFIFSFYTISPGTHSDMRTRNVRNLRTCSAEITRSRTRTRRRERDIPISNIYNSNTVKA